MEGYVHSIYSGGMVDGPGIRTIVFLSGCPLRCLYCHNPDSWVKTDGEVKSVDDVMAEILKYMTFYRTSGGGVTISGGEPFTQPVYMMEVLKACMARGIHTAIDTSGYAEIEDAERVLPYVDLLLLDIKAFRPQTYKKVTGVEIDKTLALLALARDKNKPVWVRYVLVPGLTDDLAEIRGLAEFLRGYPNVQKVDILPFHKQGEAKWLKRGIAYTLENTPPPSKEVVQVVKEILSLK